jgi:hypothetical protein
MSKILKQAFKQCSVGVHLYIEFFSTTYQHYDLPFPEQQTGSGWKLLLLLWLGCAVLAVFASGQPLSLSLQVREKMIFFVFNFLQINAINNSKGTSTKL